MLLKKLTEASGVSGDEKNIRDLIIDEVKDYVDDITIDSLGNLIVYKSGNSKRKIMLAAHMDEIGLMVSDIDSQGHLKFIPVGGIDKRILVSKEVRVGDNMIPGVIGAKPIHLQKRQEWTNALEIDQLYIDIGASSREEANKLVEIGDYITFASEYQEFGNNLAMGKALDDRIGCGVLINLIKELKDIEFYGVFTVMEEVGLVGAGPAAYRIEPDFALILEGTVCYDVPGLDEHSIPTKLGKGPAISLIDRSTIYKTQVVDNIVNLAKKNNIPYQFRKTSMGGNDSGVIHIQKEGCLTATLSAPCRYIHSPTSVVSLDDYENMIALSKEILKYYSREEY